MPERVSKRDRLIRDLLRSPEPSIRWRTRVRVLGEARSSLTIRRLEREVRRSARTQRLLSRRAVPYRKGKFGGVYRYWQGTHWALASLADLGYPARDPALTALIDRMIDMWTQPAYDRTVPTGARTISGVRDGVPLLRGRYRRCASQQGNALLSLTLLGVVDERAEHLAELLRRWQWSDGGWNCDRSPEADTSSFMETLLPMRGLAAYARRTKSRSAQQAAERAAELFLKRRMFRRCSDGAVMRPDFLRLHYPLYWHYDVLGGLKGIAEVGRLDDGRCREALEWLEGKELSGGGWPTEARYYRVSPSYRFGAEFVDWGAPSPRRRNDWVTTDALFVLRAAGRL